MKVWSQVQLQQKVREAQDAVWSQTASRTEAQQLLLQLQGAAKTDCGGIVRAACSAPGPETTDRALAMLRAFIVLDPGESQNFLHLATVLRQAGSHDLAAVETLEAVRLAKEGTKDWARVVGLAHDLLVADPDTAEMCSGRVERPEWLRGKALGRVSQAAFDVAPDDFYVCQMHAFVLSNVASRQLEAVALFRKAVGLSTLKRNKLRCADLANACLEAHKATIGKGIKYRLTGLRARPELNATPCTALRLCDGPEGRWEVVLENGDTIRVLPEKLEHMVECNQRFPDIVKQVMNLDQVLDTIVHVARSSQQVREALSQLAKWGFATGGRGMVVFEYQPWEADIANYIKSAEFWPKARLELEFPGFSPATGSDGEPYSPDGDYAVSHYRTEQEFMIALFRPAPYQSAAFNSLRHEHGAVLAPRTCFPDERPTPEMKPYVVPCAMNANLTAARRCSGPACTVFQLPPSAAAEWVAPCKDCGAVEDCEHRKDVLGTPLKICQRCKSVYYCSKECQLKHWRAGHKRECSVPASHSA